MDKLSKSCTCWLLAKVLHPTQHTGQAKLLFKKQTDRRTHNTQDKPNHYRDGIKLSACVTLLATLPLSQ